MLRVRTGAAVVLAGLLLAGSGCSDDHKGAFAEAYGFAADAKTRRIDQMAVPHIAFCD